MRIGNQEVITASADRLRFLAAVCAVLCATLLALAAPARAELGFGGFGSGAGQTDSPQGVAVDNSTNRLYVADEKNNRIDVFGTDGDFLFAFGWGVADGTTAALQSCGPAAAPPTANCFKGLAGSGAGQLTIPRRIAVDDDPASPAFHDVYVTDATKGIQRFSPAGAFLERFGAAELSVANAPITTGPGGVLYAADGTSGEGKAIRRFSPAGALLGTSELPGNGFVWDIAVDSTGDLYIASSGEVQKYELSEPQATLLDAFDQGSNTFTVAVRSGDHLFAGQKASSEAVRFVAEHDSDGTLLRRFGYGEIDFNLKGLAADASGDLFGSEENAGAPSPGNRIVRLAPPGPGPLACCMQTTTSATAATLSGKTNPEGKSTTYHFEYLTQADYAANGDSFSGPNPAIKTPESTPVGSDFALYPAEAQIGCANPDDPPQPECLEPSTAYRFRLVAENADGESSSEGTFTTKPPFEITGTWASSVGIDEATVNAAVNPTGIPATAYFEYVTDAQFHVDGFAGATKVPEAPIELGNGEEDFTATAQLTDLEPGTTYRYRVAVADLFLTDVGPTKSLITYPLAAAPRTDCPNQLFRAGPSASLPDCRAYEMVSPVDKNGGDIKALPGPNADYPAYYEQAAADGARLTYSSATAFADAPSAPYTSQYLAGRGPNGWETHGISPPRASQSLGTDIRIKFDVQYKAFTEDLGSGYLLHDTDPPLEECAPEGYPNFYRRDNATGRYEALSIGKPANQTADGLIPEIQGVSADGTHTVFRANAKLLPEASSALAGGKPIYQLYMHVRGEGCGELRLISTLPNGKASPLQSSAGVSRGFTGTSRDSAVTHAVSDDGTRVFWTSVNFPSEPGALYVRVHADQPQSAVASGKCTEVDKACTLEISPAGAQFRTASTDGSKVFYTLNADLYEAEITDTSATPTLIAKEVPGVVGASANGSRLYFVSREALGGEGEAKEPNLYLREGGQVHLVGTLFEGNGSNGDLDSGFYGLAVSSGFAYANGVRVTADGSRLAFVSRAGLTGYDNNALGDGRPAVEVYLYDAETDHLLCVSCNPSGARPQGRVMGRFADNGEDSRRPVAARIGIVTHDTYTSRPLSADGSRLFFESFDALLPRDTNGKADVYEWEEAADQAGCTAIGAELYVPSAAGCISLISSGTDKESDAAFVDASADGSDVFFRTGESLLTQDPGQVDIYDARIGGGFPTPVTPTPCEGESCQPPVAAPTFSTPRSDVPGPGNAKPRPPKTPKCPKGTHRVKGKGGKTRCVRNHKPRHPNKNRGSGR